MIGTAFYVLGVIGCIVLILLIAGGVVGLFVNLFISAADAITALTRAGQPPRGGASSPQP